MEYSRQFEISVNRVLKFEGGYVNDPADRGGETNFGITKKVALQLEHKWRDFGWGGDMKTLPLDFAKYVYYTEYWCRCGCNAIESIDPILADHLFDVAVNSGVRKSVRDLQSLLNMLNREERDYVDIVEDGLYGKGTLNALVRYAEKRGKSGLCNLTLTLVQMQTAFYIRITKNRKKNENFLNGWLNRCTRKLKVYMRKYDM